MPTQFLCQWIIMVVKHQRFCFYFSKDYTEILSDELLSFLKLSKLIKNNDYKFTLQRQITVSIVLIQSPGSQTYIIGSVSASSGSKLSHEFISQQFLPVDSVIFLQIEVLFSRNIMFTQSGLLPTSC